MPIEWHQLMGWRFERSGSILICCVGAANALEERPQGDLFEASLARWFIGAVPLLLLLVVLFLLCRIVS